MVRVIVTACGQSIRRTMLPMDALRQLGMRNALIGCGTLDDNGLYVEIASVYFIEV